MAGFGGGGKKIEDRADGGTGANWIGCAAVATMMGQAVRLFRAVSIAEWADIHGDGGFGSIPSSMQGHWFAETAADASIWGHHFYTAAGQPFVVIEVEVPQPLAASLYRLPNLDNIGPARFAEDAELVTIN